MNSNPSFKFRRWLRSNGVPASLTLVLALGTSSSPEPARDSASASAPAHAWIRTPSRDFFGLRLGMSREAAHERLDRIGHPQGSEREEGDAETWALRDPRYGFITVGFDRSEHVSWYSLFVRRGGAPVLLRDIGDLAHAQRRGNYIYVWSLPARSGRPACKVIARSQNPDTLQSLSVSSLHADARAPGAVADSAR